MREIRFRAWHLDEEVMGKVTKMDLWSDDPDEHSFEIFTEEDEIIDDCGLNEIVLMQYTGMKDSKGQSIYEGDILRTHRGNFVVTWENYTFTLEGYYCPSNDVPNDYFSERGQDEVIGNIYENPELVEVMEK